MVPTIWVAFIPDDTCEVMSDLHRECILKAIVAVRKEG